MKDIFGAIVGVLIVIVAIILMLFGIGSCLSGATEAQLRLCLEGQHNYDVGWPQRELINERLYMVWRCICGERKEEAFSECPTCLRDYK